MKLMGNAATTARTNCGFERTVSRRRGSESRHTCHSLSVRNLHQYMYVALSARSFGEGKRNQEFDEGR